MITTAERDGQPSLKKRSAHRIKLFALAATLFVMLAAGDKAETAANELEGLWQSRGYGMVAQVTPDHVRLIERTPVSCLSTGNYSTTRFLSEFEVQPNHQERAFEIRNDGTLSAITFEPLNDRGIDQLCPAGLTPQTDDPELNFEVLWHTFDQHYAFFSERNVGWDAVYAEFRPQIDRETTRRELGKALGEMLEKLGDAHVTLHIDDNDMVSVESRLADRLLEECREQWSVNCHLGDYLEERYASFEKILRTAYLEDRFKTAFDESAIWGQIAESTG